LQSEDQLQRLEINAKNQENQQLRELVAEFQQESQKNEQIETL
jgi:hypothetical protein